MPRDRFRKGSRYLSESPVNKVVIDEWLEFLAVVLGEDLSRVHLSRGWTAGLLTGALGASAVTLGRRIFFSASAWGRLADGRIEALELVAHEVVHVAQIRRLGLIRFLREYCWEYLRHRMAGRDHMQSYRALSAEVEARRLAQLCVEAALEPTTRDRGPTGSRGSVETAG